MKRLIFFKGIYDTLDLFTEELSNAFRIQGYETEILDVRNMQESLIRLSEFVKQPVKAAITFNNLAFNMELREGENIWEQLGIPCINILMDHPCFYHEALNKAPFNSVVLCTDINHMKYVQRFYPNVPVSGFLPHAGCIHITDYKKLGERGIDVLYAGGLSAYVNDAIRPDWGKYQKSDGEELGERVLRRLIEDPSCTTEEVVESILISRGIVLKDEELRLLISDMRYIEGLAVSHFREGAVKILVEAGIKVTVYGVGWEKSSLASHPNLDYRGKIPAKEILEKMKDTKIVLSTMTWFKDGTHDRVFNGMLAGALAVTDTSGYMQENFHGVKEMPWKIESHTSKAQLVFFELNQMEALPEKVKYLLGHLEESQAIADRAYQKANEEHTWDVRAREIEEALFL